MPRKYPKLTAEKVKYLAFEGGGGKGWVYAGVSGSSAGAINAFLYYLGVISTKRTKQYLGQAPDFFEPLQPGFYKAVKSYSNRNGIQIQIGYAVNEKDKLVLEDTYKEFGNTADLWKIRLFKHKSKKKVWKISSFTS